MVRSILFVLVVFAGMQAGGQEIKKWKITNLDSAIRKADKPTIFNFWATFCKPCVAEIPYFQQLVGKYDSTGVQLILVSLDLPEYFPTRIKNFAAARGFTAPIQYLDETDADAFCPIVDSSWSGAIPASLFINNKTGFRYFHEGELKGERFEEILREMTGVAVK